MLMLMEEYQLSTSFSHSMIMLLISSWAASRRRVCGVHLRKKPEHQTGHFKTHSKQWRHHAYITWLIFNPYHGYLQKYDALWSHVSVKPHLSRAAGTEGGLKARLPARCSHIGGCSSGLSAWTSTVPGTNSASSPSARLRTWNRRASKDTAASRVSPALPGALSRRPLLFAVAQEGAVAGGVGLVSQPQEQRLGETQRQRELTPQLPHAVQHQQEDGRLLLETSVGEGWVGTSLLERVSCLREETHCACCFTYHT